MVIMHQCAFCKHYQGNKGVTCLCSAFPEGIPDEIINNEFDHKQPYPGDHNIHWEQSESSLQRMGPIDLFAEVELPVRVLSKAS